MVSYMGNCVLIRAACAIEKKTFTWKIATLEKKIKEEDVNARSDREFQFFFARRHKVEE
jgi:hypothetical protein